MKSLSPLAYVPRRGTLQQAGLGPAALYLGAYAATHLIFLSRTAALYDRRRDAPAEESDELS